MTTKFNALHPQQDVTDKQSLHISYCRKAPECSRNPTPGVLQDDISLVKDKLGAFPELEPITPFRSTGENVKLLVEHNQACAGSPRLS